VKGIDRLPARAEKASELTFLLRSFDGSVK